MAIEERQKMIEQIVNREGSISFAKLEGHFPNISAMTLRRDLESLDKSNRIIRVHGGAKSIDVAIGTDDQYVRRSIRNVENKQDIAKKALNILHPNTSVFIDSGTTTTELCRVFPDESFLLFTSGLSCAVELSKLIRPKIHILGGVLNSMSLSINGPESNYYVENINFNMAFIGCMGFASHCGFTCGIDEESKLKKNIISKSETVVVLMDSSKVGIIDTFSFASLNDIDIVISDKDLNENVRREFTKNNIQVIV